MKSKSREVGSAYISPLPRKTGLEQTKTLDSAQGASAVLIPAYLSNLPDPQAPDLLTYFTYMAFLHSIWKGTKHFT